MSDLQYNKAYRFGWYLLLIQNILLIAIFLVGVPVFSNKLYQLINSFGWVNYFSKGVNYIFTFTLCLDLISIFFISKGSFSFFSSKQIKVESINYKNKEFLIPLFGFLWILFSFLWRVPFYFQGGFDLGYMREGKLWELEDNPLYNNLLNNPFMLFMQIIGAFCLFFFLYLQEKYYLSILDFDDDHSDLGNLNVGRETILGALNIIAMILLFFGSNLIAKNPNSLSTYGSRPNGLFLLMGLIIKVTFIPILTIATCKKILSLTRYSSVNQSNLKLENESKALLYEQVVDA